MFDVVSVVNFGRLVSKISSRVSMVEVVVFVYGMLKSVVFLVEDVVIVSGRFVEVYVVDKGRV